MLEIGIREIAPSLQLQLGYQKCINNTGNTTFLSIDQHACSSRLPGGVLMQSKHQMMSSIEICNK